MTFPVDLSPLFQDTITGTALKAPDHPVDPNDAFQFLEYKLARTKYENHEEQLTSNLTALFALIWGQCREGMKAKLKAQVEKNGLSPLQPTIVSGSYNRSRR